jgi:hypothetical protein
MMFWREEKPRCQQVKKGDHAGSEKQRYDPLYAAFFDAAPPSLQPCRTILEFALLTSKRLDAAGGKSSAAPTCFRITPARRPIFRARDRAEILLALAKRLERIARSSPKGLMRPNFSFGGFGENEL